MSEVLDKFISRLTDSYNKNPGSNVYKLAQIAAGIIQEGEDTLNRIGEWRDVDQAQGEVLDILGQNVRQRRGAASDEVYRVMIKSKIKRNLSNGSINTLIDFLSFILQIPKTSIKVNELWKVGQPAGLKIDLPLDKINATGLSRKQFGTLVNLVTVAGVNAEVLFEGTFAFSSVYDTSQTDVATGFTDATGTNGGTLGDAFDPANDFELPFE